MGTHKHPALDRTKAHAKLDEVFDELERLAVTNGGLYLLERVMLQVEPDHSITGCVLVWRSHAMLGMNHVTWGIAPYGDGMNSGHYDLTPEAGHYDWLSRVDRGW